MEAVEVKGRINVERRHSRADATLVDAWFMASREVHARGEEGRCGLDGSKMELRRLARAGRIIDLRDTTFSLATYLARFLRFIFVEAERRFLAKATSGIPHYCQCSVNIHET